MSAAAGSGRNGGDGELPEDDVAASNAASNAASRQYDWRPRPDPTVLTTQQLRATEESLNRTILERVAGLRELLEQRLNGMDEATRLLSGRMLETAGEIDGKSAGRHDALQELLQQRLEAIELASRVHADQVSRILVEAEEARDRIRTEFAAADLALRELLGARIDGMDQATRLLAQNMDKVPLGVDRDLKAQREVLTGEISQVRAVTLEKFAAVDALFASNATALTAALAAQEKAVAEQNKSNTLAIDKSEAATKETIAANVNQTTSGLRSLSTVMDDLKARLVRLEALTQNQRVASEDSLAVNTFGQTAEQNRAVQARATMQLAIAGISALIAIIAVLFAVLHK